MARILRNSGNEDRNRKVERVAAPQNTDVHMEAVEGAANKGGEPEKTGDARMDGIPKREHSQRILGGCRQRNINTHHNKRKTCTPRIL